MTKSLSGGRGAEKSGMTTDLARLGALLHSSPRSRGGDREAPLADLKALASLFIFSSTLGCANRLVTRGVVDDSARDTWLPSEEGKIEVVGHARLREAWPLRSATAKPARAKCIPRLSSMQQAHSDLLLTIPFVDENVQDGSTKSKLLLHHCLSSQLSSSHFYPRDWQAIFVLYVVSKTLRALSDDAAIDKNESFVNPTTYKQCGSSWRRASHCRFASHSRRMRRHYRLGCLESDINCMGRTIS